MKNILIFIVNLLHNLINPSRLPVCRFEPSCSRYAIQALDAHGSFRGISLIFNRLIKCQPWGTYGFDPVPAPQFRNIRKA